MTASIFLQDVGLVILFSWSWFHFYMPFRCRKLFISFRFFNFVEYSFLKYDLMILWISSVPDIMYLFSLLILLTWIFPLCLGLNKDLSMLFIFSKKQIFVLFLCIVLFVSILLISALNLVISWCPLLLGEFALFVLEFSGVLLSC